MFGSCRRDHGQNSVKLWATYDEVSDAFPNNQELRVEPRRLHPLTPEEAKLEPVYGLDLSEKYGIYIGFNEDKQVVRIARLVQATEVPKKPIPANSGPGER